MIQYVIYTYSIYEHIHVILLEFKHQLLDMFIDMLLGGQFLWFLQGSNKVTPTSHLNLIRHCECNSEKSYLSHAFWASPHQNAAPTSDQNQYGAFFQMKRESIIPLNHIKSL